MRFAISFTARERWARAYGSCSRSRRHSSPARFRHRRRASPEPPPRFRSRSIPDSRYAAFSGMEPLLFAAFAAVAVLAFLRERRWSPACSPRSDPHATRRCHRHALLATIHAPAARSHAMVEPFTERIRDAACIALPGILCALAWAFLCWRVSGRPLPNTFLNVKAERSPRWKRSRRPRV